MKKTLLWRILLLASVVCPAVAQTSAIVSAAGGSVTVDASRLNTIIPLDAPWRFHAGDDPRFADPTFDDSAWPLIQPGENKLLADAHVPNIPNGRSWARLHVHILNVSGPLAIIVTQHGLQQYAVFANGKQVGSTQGYATENYHYYRPDGVELPQTRDVVLAVHFVIPGGGLAHYFPLDHLEVGQSEAVGDRSDLGHYRDFEDQPLTALAIGLIVLAVVPVSLALLLVQRSHREYLWLAVFCLFAAMDHLRIPAILTGWLSARHWVQTLGILIHAGVTITSLEFVAALADFRPRRAIRIVQVSLLVSPVLFGLSAYTANLFSDAAASVFYLMLTVYILFPAYRRGRKECGLLFIPLSLFPIAEVVDDAQSLFPNLFVPLRPGHLGGVGVTLADVCSLLFIACLLAVVLYRFFRVSKDEEIAAAELEAARTVQQLLIPATSPSTPGFSVESVYLPAQQVGGDFFLVLPAPEGSDDHSLLAIMGDVSGKGLQAAMVVSTILGGLRMQLSRQPAEVLAHLNRMLTGHVSGFATCCAALIHADGRMTIANAGNPAPYCDGEEVPTLAGLPLGLVSGVAYEETAYTVPAGSHLTFVSDGVVEATSFPAKELFGFDRTRAISVQSASMIADAASKFGAGAPQADDITVLTVTRT